MCNRVLLLFGKLPQWNLHVNCHVNGTRFQSGLRFQTGLSSLWVSCKRALAENMSSKFQESQEFGSEKDRYFLKILRWYQKLVRDYMQGKLFSYFLNNAVITCLYGLKISEIIEIEHIFQSKAFFHLSGNLPTSCFSALKYFK